MNKVENIVAKVKIACLEQFLLLSLCFQKVVLLQRHLSMSGSGKDLTIGHLIPKSILSDICRPL